MSELSRVLYRFLALTNPFQKSACSDHHCGSVLTLSPPSTLATQACTSSPSNWFRWTVRTCRTPDIRYENLWLHSLHMYGWAPECVIPCRSNIHRWTKALPHTGQLCLLLSGSSNCGWGGKGLIAKRPFSPPSRSTWKDECYLLSSSVKWSNKNLFGNLFWKEVPFGDLQVRFLSAVDGAKLLDLDLLGDSEIFIRIFI